MNKFLLGVFATVAHGQTPLQYKLEISDSMPVILGTYTGWGDTKQKFLIDTSASTLVTFSSECTYVADDANSVCSTGPIFASL